jgi:hypothetical protein
MGGEHKNFGWKTSRQEAPGKTEGINIKKKKICRGIETKDMKQTEAAVAQSYSV